MYTREEQRIRRKLGKIGYSLHKWNGGYMIVLDKYNGAVAGADFPLTLEEAEDWMDRLLDTE